MKKFLAKQIFKDFDETFTRHGKRYFSYRVVHLKPIRFWASFIDNNNDFLSSYFVKEILKSVNAYKITTTFIPGQFFVVQANPFIIEKHDNKQISVEEK